MKLVEHYIMRGTRRLVLIIVGFLIFIFASYSAQRYLTEAANGTLALDVVLDIVFYKVLIALEMLLPVGLYVSVGVTLGQMYTDSEITAISAAGGSPGRLYKAVLLSGDTAKYFLSPFCRCMVVRGLIRRFINWSSSRSRSWMFASCGQRNLTLTITDE